MEDTVEEEAVSEVGGVSKVGVGASEEEVDFKEGEAQEGEDSMEEIEEDFDSKSNYMVVLETVCVISFCDVL